MSDSSSSLKNFDSPADRIRQHRQVRKGPIVIVEGPDDVSVLESILSGVDFFPVGGKRSVFTTTAQLAEWSMAGFVAITDRDFDGESQYEVNANFHFPYSGVDLEEMLIKLGVLAKVLRHVGSAEKISAFGGMAAIEDSVSRVAIVVGEIRRQNAAYGWGVNFDSVNLADKVDRNSLELKIDSYCSALLAGHRGSGDVDLSRLLTAAHEAKGAAYKGKDALAATSAALRKLVGTLDKAACDTKLLGDMLRAASSYEVSRSTWFRELRAQVDTYRLA